MDRYRKERFGALANNSRCIEHKYIVSFFKWCVNKGLLLSFPVVHWRPPSCSRPPCRCLSIAQIERILNVFDTDTALGLRNRTIVEMFYATGIRRVELINLDVSDVDMATGRVLVQGKGDKERIVPIIRSALRWTRRYLEESRPHFIKDPGCQALFLVNRGTRITFRAINRFFWHLQKQTRISALTPHALRHSCATHLMDAGVPLPYIQKFLGHSHITSTQRYLHVTSPELKRNYDKAHPREKWDLSPK